MMKNLKDEYIHLSADLQRFFVVFVVVVSQTGESIIRECIKWLFKKISNMPLSLSELCHCRKASTSLQRSKIWHNKREQLDLHRRTWPFS